MQKNLNKYGSTVGLEFSLHLKVEEELVAEFTVQENWNNRIRSGTITLELVLKNMWFVKHGYSSSRTRCCRMVSRRVEHAVVERYLVEWNKLL